MDRAASPQEEFASTLTHAVAALAALVAGAGLVLEAAGTGDSWRVVAASVFAGSMLLLYVASAFYHSATQPLRKQRLKVLDHCAIYLLIAGTYTPFTLIALRDSVGWWLFAAVWSLALLGIVFKLFHAGRFKWASTLVYVAMGWLAVFELQPVRAALDPATFAWVLAGGIAYTLGTAFYLRPSMSHSHTVWHLFVIAGSACHYVAVFQLVAMPV